MARTITLCYRKLIDAASVRAWDKLVFEDTYAEFRLQAQNFNPGQQYRSFGQLLQHTPGAGQLHFLVSAAARGYVQQLGGLVPDVLDSLGRHFLKFSQFQFEIINSDLLDKSWHQVAVNFFSEPLLWHDTIGTALLVSEAAAEPPAGAAVPTTLFQLPPFLSIHSLHYPA
ncbi:hypothetical protein E5K00_08155 [Hymenobacter aquaticus]|uniref:Uncharacterized protein n=1 Tax=Hymenobacter aquaticus TaxID=1867101 RepID=A0A4Z0Q523_9BACT|nr:hypothetical protein [Hymenobacter aquaticus]TGE25157.1 hypothetical protein E5K00_08155 [Hymenobacter aquaticus]